MQQLYNELISPVITYNDKGEQVQTAPTALMLRASRALKQLADTNDINNALVQKLQLMLAEVHEDINNFKVENESLRKSGQQISDVGSNGALDQRVDSTSEAGIQAEDGSPGTS